MIFRGVDVSFDYSISFSVNSESSVTDLVATRYVINGSEELFDSESIIEGHVSYSDDRSIPTKITIYFIWNDEPGAMMNNIEDTNATFAMMPDGVTPRLATFDVTVQFTQTPIEYNNVVNDIEP